MRKNFINGLFPEGWAFFTRDPREERISIYRKVSEHKIAEYSLSNSISDIYWGGSRGNRVLHGKLSKIANDIDPELWTSISVPDAPINNIELDSLNVLRIKADPPMVYGEYIIKASKPIPYMWYSKSNKELSITSRFVIIKIEK